LVDNPDACRQAGIIESAAKRASRLISQLQHFSQRDHYRLQPLDPRVLITDVTGILESSLRKNISIVQEFNHDDARISVDRSSMCHVLLNLAFNARDAMPDGGTLTLATFTIETEDGVPAVQLRLSDSGTGIRNDVLGRVFDPFFTTKAADNAPGMGLTIARGFVEDQGGIIELESEPGDGTTAVVTIPALQPSMPPVTVADLQPAATGEGSGKGEVILVVEDEADLRHMTRSILERQGYRVLLAVSGEDAIDVFERNADEIDLVILDMIMPGVDGIAVYEKLKEIGPKTKLILTSGYLNNPPFQHILDRGEEPFIQKPWDLNDLISQTRRVLAGD